MPTAAEGLETGKTELAGGLAAGVGAVSSNQTIKFTKYVKLVLPLDGYVFWVKADLLSPGALANAALANALSPNEAGKLLAGAPSFDAQGSLHVATDNKQQADSAYAVNRVVFTSLRPVDDLNAVGPRVLFIGEFEGEKFAFSQRKSYYRQSGLHHYVGDAVYPIMESQLVDALEGFDGRDLIVSNSLPIWLSMNAIAPAPWEKFYNPSLTLYPSYLVPENTAPPFAAVDIPPGSTSAIAASPTLGPTLSHDQLVSDHVKITLWGLDNEQALRFVDFVNQFSVDTGLIGMMSAPVVRDEKSIQVELGTLAKKKTYEVDVSYLQSQARNVARQLIVSAIPTFEFN